MNRNKEQAKTKIPLHLRLTTEDWEECCKTLNPAEIKVFIWIRASDPYGDRELKINCSELGLRLGLHKSSISRALRSLDEKKLIEIELEQVSVKQKVSNRRLTLLCKEENESKQEKTEEKENVASTQQPLHQRNSRCTNATTIAPAQQPLHSRTQQPPEPLHYKDSSEPHTIQTYSDFKKTLSKSERESFEKFVKEEYFRTEGKKIRSFTAFMSNDHFQEWYQKYQNRPEAVETAQKDKWENHPQREEWVAAIEKCGNPLMFALRDQEKQEFVKWANDNKLFSWLQEEQ